MHVPVTHNWCMCLMYSGGRTAGATRGMAGAGAKLAKLAHPHALRAYARVLEAGNASDVREYSCTLRGARVDGAAVALPIALCTGTVWALTEADGPMDLGFGSLTDGGNAPCWSCHSHVLSCFSQSPISPLYEMDRFGWTVLSRPAAAYKASRNRATLS